MRVAVIFDNLGPYHRARLEAVKGGRELVVIEVRAASRDYAWESTARECSFEVLRLAGNRSGIGRRVAAALDAIGPAVVFIPGWSSKASFAALGWCLKRGRPAVAMCESNEHDEPRTAWKEWVKRRIVGRCAAALAGGRFHTEYLARLGLPRDRIFFGYDAVDNAYFATGAEAVRNQPGDFRQRHGLPDSFFLASARFIEKKNLARLIDAYAQYRTAWQTSHHGSSDPNAPWDLVILGDGPLRSQLEDQTKRLSLARSVHLPGFKQYPDLPVFYGLAGTFVHASTTEPWGLVVNEAMAAGLPVLVSNRCGCAPELVCEERNGFTFDPGDIERLAALMERVGNMSGDSRRQMGAAGREMVAAWGPERFADGFQQACEAALREPAPVGCSAGLWADRVLLRALGEF